VNRAERLRRVIPGADDALIAALAAKPAGEVDMIVAALRQARRDERQHQADQRRQRKSDGRRFRHYDSGELTKRNIRLLDSAGRRAATGDLDALAGFAEFTRHADRVMRLAVIGLRAQGISDEVIGGYLGITRQAVGQRFGRKGSFTLDSRSDAG
jgi:hypothetical protein